MMDHRHHPEQKTVTSWSAVLQKNVGGELTFFPTMLINAIVLPFHSIPRKKTGFFCEDFSLFAEHLRH